MPRLLRRIYAVLLALLAPLVWPVLPMNTTIFDYMNAVFIIAVFACALYFRRMDKCLLLPMSAILFTSVLSMLNSTAVATNLVTILQEIYLFTIFLAIYNAFRDESDLKTFVVSWLACAALESTLILFEVSGASGVRAQGTFENPNMAASYLGVSSFLIWQPFVRIPWSVNGLLLVLVTAGLFATKSLSALLGCVLGLASIPLLHWLRSRGNHRQRFGIAVLAIGVAALALSPAIRTVHNYFDRVPKTTEERSAIWRVGIRTFLEHPLGTGIGPAGFGEVGFVSGGYWGVGRRISLHSDYLAFLVERGLPGFVALALLLGGLGSMLLRSLRNPGSSRDFLWGLGLTAMFIFILIDAASHEVMHYRHVWLGFALIAVRDRLVGRRPDRTRAAAPAPGRAAVTGR